MLPSRGLRPVQFAPLASRQAMLMRSSASRQFSSLPRTGLSTSLSRASPRQSAPWRTGASGHPHMAVGISPVRYGSWYAPWSWGRSSTPGDAGSLASPDAVPIAQFSNRPVSEFVSEHAAPAVTAATPEIAPAAIDRAAVVDGLSNTSAATADAASASFDPTLMDELLGRNPVQDAAPVAEIDPTRLIDHPGHLAELGLEYGWGMTTVFEKTIESIYLTSGWGWAGSIMAAGVAVRGLTFFFQALSSDKMAALAALTPVTKPIQQKMEEAIARGDKQQADLYKMQQSEIMKPYVGGFLSMGGFMVVQGWIGFCAFRFLRAMGELPVPGMAHDGFLWFTDLTVRDPYFLLPAATTAIMYTVFKTGGETGIQNDTGQAATRQKMFTGLAVVLGLVTAFQASALQLYFLVSGVLGGITGWLLRRNAFRRLIRIRPLPSKESNELYSKLVADGKPTPSTTATKSRYQAPTTARAARKPANLRTAATLADINIKPAAAASPMQLRSEAPKSYSGRPTADVDFADGAKGKPLSQKLDYYKRNYRVSFLWRRFQDGAEKMIRQAGYGGKKVSEQQAKRKQRAEQYEVERRRRFENRM